MFVFMFILFLSTSNGFLLEKNNTGGSALTDQHYVHLMSLFYQEKENSQKMEQLVLKLNGEVKSLQMACLNNGNESTQEMTDLKNGYAALQQELIQVKQEINQVKNDNVALAKKNEICSNSTMRLKTELETFTHSISAGNLKNMTQIQSSFESLENKVDKTTTKLNSLMSSSNARSQDFLALLNQTRDAHKKITSLDTETKLYQNSTNQKFTALETKTQHNLLTYQNTTNQKFMTLQTDFHGYQTSTNQKFTSLQTDFHGYQSSTNQTFTSLQTDFHGYQTSTNQKINDAFQKITSINQTVVMTFCAAAGTVSAGFVVKFPYPKTIYGISDVNAFKSFGKFTCEVGGVYLFSVFIMSESNPSMYQMHKNNDVIAYVYVVDGKNNGLNYHTGTGIVAVSLNVGDTLYVKAYNEMYVNGGYSCMTVIKIR